MKKFLALIMALAMVFALVACGPTEDNESNESIESIVEVIVVSSDESTTDTSSDTPSTTTPPPTPSQQTPVACTHNNVQVAPAVAATCGVEGKTEGKTCKDCGAIIVASQAIPKLEQHFFTAATTEKPATCTVCGLTRGGVKEDVPPVYLANSTLSYNGATITFSVKEVKYVENKTKCNIIYHVSIANGSTAGTYSWKVDVAHGDVGSIVAANIPGSTPSSLAPNEIFEQDFETGPVGLVGPVGYKLTFK